MNEYSINLKNIVLNALQIKATLYQGCRFCAVVKANAYGMGAVRVAHALKSVADYFAVARPDELEALRKSGIKTPILVLGSFSGDDIRRILSNRGEMQVNSLEELREVSREAVALRQIAFVHLAFDTGMHRFGFLPSEAQAVADCVAALKNVCVKGVFSHIASSQNAESRNRQLQLFSSIKPFFPGVIFHLAASGAYRFPEFQQDMVRVGLDMYIGKHPSMAFKGKVLSVTMLKKGDSCGYSNAYTAPEDQKIATISLGYADGVPRAAAGKAEVLIKGEKATIVAVCMDSSIVRLPQDIGIMSGDVVIIWGKLGKNYVNVFDFASCCGTISYEVLTGVSQRVPRKYLFR